MLEPKRTLDIDNDVRLGLKDLLIIYTMKQTIEGDLNAVVGLLTAVRSTTPQSGTDPRLKQQTNKMLLMWCRTFVPTPLCYQHSPFVEKASA